MQLFISLRVGAERFGPIEVDVINDLTRRGRGVVSEARLAAEGRA